MNTAFIMKVIVITMGDISNYCLIFKWRDDGDGRDDVLESGGGVKNIVTIDTTVTAEFGRGAGCPFQRAALLGNRPQTVGQSPAPSSDGVSPSESAMRF